jgi:hypothetical protein
MRKWIVLMAVFLLVIVAGTAQAIQISMTDNTPRYWGWMDVSLDGNPMHVGAGRFYTTIHDGEKEIDTFSYCVDLEHYFAWDTRYTAAVMQPSDNYLEAAWLVSQYDPFTGKQYQGQSVTDGQAKGIAMTLQLAIWGTLYSDFSPVAGGDMALLATMQDSLKSIGSFDASAFFVADISGQDQLVAAPVPEPATMLLMGIGLLGLGVVGRKRIK